MACLTVCFCACVCSQLRGFHDVRHSVTESAVVGGPRFAAEAAAEAATKKHRDPIEQKLVRTHTWAG